MSAEIVQFVPRARSLPSDRIRMQMIREARAQYQAIFPDEPKALADWSSHTSDALGYGLVWGVDPGIEDTAPCECNPSPDNLA